MAYAFSKLDDYFRRSKTGAQGSLERGTTGAPPPTVQAGNLAKTAETSGEQGNAGAYRAARGADTSAIQSRLSEPAQKQAQEWTGQVEKQAADYRTGGQQQIAETYKPFNAADIASAEKGESPATSRLTEQSNYTGSEIAFQPFQVETPELDTSSMLRGGVGGIQAALQKRGGRYTPGMGALDASILAGNREALAGLQSRLGDISQGARQKKAQVELTDEALQNEAKARAVSTRSDVREALQERLRNLTMEQEAALNQRIAQNNAAYQRQLQDAIRQGISQGFDYNSPTIQAALPRMQQLGYMPNPAQFGTVGRSTYEQGPTAGQTNLSNILGTTVNPIGKTYTTFSNFDPNAFWQQFYPAYTEYQDYQARQDANARYGQN